MKITEFILNDQTLRTDCPEGLPLLDFIRYEAGLTGTKCGCREGDCGACTVMEGILKEGSVSYHTIVSCLAPLGSVHGRHIVTIEGIDGKELHPVQKAVIDHSATQCGFCTPGVVMSLVSASLSAASPDREKITDALGGNICRCTGYKSIEKASGIVSELVSETGQQDIVSLMVEKGYLPHWFLSVPGRLAEIQKTEEEISGESLIIGGATDLMVQKADKVLVSGLAFTGKAGLKRIESADGVCTIGAGVTVNEILLSGALLSSIPGLEKHFRLISSEQIRNMATLGGNLVNGSPIADLAIFFLALDASLVIRERGGNGRTLPLRDFYLGYKTLNMTDKAYIQELNFNLPEKNDHFNFEKVSKREHLDIASVNTAMLVRVDDNKVTKMHLSAGGVAPVPKYLAETCIFLTGKAINGEVLGKADKIMQGEISPISDIRGSWRYKRLLLRQLFFAHFIELFPEKIDTELLLKNQAYDEKL